MRCLCHWFGASNQAKPSIIAWNVFWSFYYFQIWFMNLYFSNLLWKVSMRQFWWDGLYIWIVALIIWYLSVNQNTFKHKLRILTRGWNGMWLGKFWNVNCGKCQVPMFRGGLKINSWTTHMFSTLWFIWSIRYHVSSLLVVWRMWWIIQHPFECLKAFFCTPKKRMLNMWFLGFYVHLP